MFSKERTVPLKIQKLETLLRRLPQRHPKSERIQEELAKSMAGYLGEKSIDYHLSFLLEKPLFILPNLRIPDSEDRFFQLDFLILTTRYMLIIEVKNISGTLFFDQNFQQLIRTNNEKEEVFTYPITQVKRQEGQLISWLEKNKCPKLPIASIIVNSNPSTILKASHPTSEISQKVIHSATLPSKLEHFDKRFPKDQIDIKEVRKINRLLLKQNQPLNQDILKQFPIASTEILSGVHCPECLTLPMVREKGKWNCLQCNYSDRNAYIDSLRDYKLLFGEHITNKRFRDFLQISSIFAASILLVSLNLEQSGAKRNRQYNLPY